MLCIVLLLFTAGSTQAGSLPIATTYTTEPIQQVTFKASSTNVAHLPEVLQTVTYAPVVHRASSFLLHGPAISHTSAASHMGSLSSHLLPGTMHVQAIPLHLAIRVLLI